MGKLFLGVHAGHNASACIGNEESILYAVQEERLCGEKNYWGFPRRAIEACLKHADAKPSDVTSVSAGSTQVMIRYHSRDDVLESFRKYDTVKGKIRQRVLRPLVVNAADGLGQGQFKKEMNALGFNGADTKFYDHHLSHAAAAYYGLRADPDKKYLVLTCDGAGDKLSSTARVWGQGSNELVATTPWQHSLGAIYAWVTFDMGFIPMEHEYKLMGMAPYASPAAAKEVAGIFHKHFGLDGDGLTFKQKAGILPAPDSYPSDILDDLRGKRFDWICAGMQQFTEDLMTEWVQNLVRKTGVRDILAGGGVFMNVKANRVMANLDEVDTFQAFPSCGDETLSLGSFYLDQADHQGYDAPQPITNYYLGDDVDDEDTERTLAASGFPYEKPDDLEARVADILAAGHPIARCTGRMEFGARALGNRSILADPSNHDVVRIINQMVKKRDFWMPFAPMIKEEVQHEYIDNEKNLESPYMMMTFKAKENFREFIAAVHNADLTCRAQLLNERQNPEMYRILNLFQERTGRGIVLNTSFNLHGLPICKDASDALHVFRNSGLEYLNVGSYIVMKKEVAES